MSIGAQLVAIVAGGPSPLIATAAIAATGGQSWPISLWLIGVSLITLLNKSDANRAAKLIREHVEGTEYFLAGMLPAEAQSKV